MADEAVDAELMTCRDCGEQRELGEMRKRPPAKDGTPRYGPNCNSCNAQQARQWYRDNQERADLNRWAWNLWELYRITPEEYNEMLLAQAGVCAVCRQPQRSGRIKRLVVDHDHRTGAVRGLLCNSCNRALGLLGDDVEILRQMIDYLTGERNE